MEALVCNSIAFCSQRFSSTVALVKLEQLPLIDDFDNMESHEMDDVKDYATTSQVVVEGEKLMPSHAYPGQRTEGTRNTNTRVRVSDLDRCPSNFRADVFRRGSSTLHKSSSSPLHSCPHGKQWHCEYRSRLSMKRANMASATFKLFSIMAVRKH